MQIFQRASAQFQFRIWGKLHANNYHSYYLSHSLFGEDMVVRALLPGVRNGFYVDIGAHHPVYSSNTFHFYERGWRGINIDAAPGSMKVFGLVRPRDINLEACIAEQPGVAVNFFLFEDPLLNTADPQAAQEARERGLQPVKTVVMRTRTLTDVLQQYAPNTPIDYLNIDVEGLDESILRSIDLSVYRPTVISFECYLDVREGLNKVPALEFLASKDYEFQAKCGSTLIVMRRDRRELSPAHNA